MNEAKPKISKGKKSLIIIAAIIVAIFAAILIANACLPTYTVEEVKAEILRQIEPGLQEAREDLGLSDLEIEIVINEFKVERKPTIFREGSIWVYLDDYVVSDELPDFATMTYDDDALTEYGLQSYDLAEDYICYNDVELDSHNFLNIRRSSEYDLPQYRDDEGNVYTFYIGWDYTIFKNGEPVYVRPESNSGGSTSGGCKKCGDTGVALTAGGYCRTCVDIYYTDYYVDWDGEISADRPW